MPVAGGLNAQLGIAEEVTPGTPVVVSRFLEFDKENLSQGFERVDHSGLRTGRRILGANNYSVGRQSAEGDLEMVLQTKGQAVLFKHALGAVATTTPAGGTLSRAHKCTVGDLDGKSLTVQVGMRDDTGTARPKTLAGCKIAKWSLEVKENDHPMLSIGIDGMSSTLATALATASYPAGQEDYFATQAVVKVAGAEVECSELKLDVDNGLMLERYYLQASLPGTKKQQLEGDAMREIKGSCKLSFPDLVAYNRFVNNAQSSLQLTFTGPIIEGAIAHSVDALIPAVRWDGKTPAVDGVGLIPVELDFVAVDTLSADGPIVVTIVNMDTAP